MMLSVIMVVYDMREQALNTLRSLSPQQQHSGRTIPYEVIVVENQSSQMLSDNDLSGLDYTPRYYRHAPKAPSPVSAIHVGVQHAQGDYLGILIDGARITTPGIVRYAHELAQTQPDPIITVPSYHIGPDLQQFSTLKGYNEATEKALLDDIRWPEDPYQLFSISCFSGTSRAGFFAPAAESNCLFVSRHTFEQLSGYCQDFRSPGGGFANLDFYQRAIQHTQATPFLLWGEGTFHQLHGGTTTSPAGTERDQLLQRFKQEYQDIRQQAFAVTPHHYCCVGSLRPEALPFVQHSLDTVDPDHAHA